MNDQTEDIEPPEEAVDKDAEQTMSWIDLLQADTPREEIKQRPAPGSGGNRQLDYVTARFVQDRLDAAVGPMNWRTRFETLPGGATQAVRCYIAIRPPSGDEDDWVEKGDVGIPSSIEPEKGAHSDAFKRAAVHWGIARDLYDDRDEQHLAPVAQAAPQMQMPAQGGSVRAQVMGGAVGPDQQQGMAPGAFVQQVPGIVQYDENGGAPGGGPAWLCSIHEDAKIVPAGVSKRTGRKYNAFYACPVAGCDEKGPSA